MFHTYLLGNRGPTIKESDLGELDNIAATESAKKNVSKSYVKYMPKERCNIEKYAKWQPLLLSENSEKKDPILMKAVCEHLPKNIKINWN